MTMLVKLIYIFNITEISTQTELYSRIGHNQIYDRPYTFLGIW